MWTCVPLLMFIEVGTYITQQNFDGLLLLIVTVVIEGDFILPR
jgi:hypothetical protein